MSTPKLALVPVAENVGMQPAVFHELGAARYLRGSFRPMDHLAHKSRTRCVDRFLQESVQKRKPKCGTRIAGITGETCRVDCDARSVRDAYRMRKGANDVASQL
jgi:hypothetical protein